MRLKPHSFHFILRRGRIEAVCRKSNLISWLRRRAVWLGSKVWRLINLEPFFMDQDRLWRLRNYHITLVGGPEKKDKERRELVVIRKLSQDSNHMIVVHGRFTVGESWNFTMNTIEITFCLFKVRCVLFNPPPAIQSHINENVVIFWNIYPSIISNERYFYWNMPVMVNVRHECYPLLLTKIRPIIMIIVSIRFIRRSNQWYWDLNGFLYI